MLAPILLLFLVFALSGCINFSTTQNTNVETNITKPISIVSSTPIKYSLEFPIENPVYVGANIPIQLKLENSFPLNVSDLYVGFFGIYCPYSIENGTNTFRALNNIFKLSELPKSLQVEPGINYYSFVFNTSLAESLHLEMKEELLAGLYFHKQYLVQFNKTINEKSFLSTVDAKISFENYLNKYIIYIQKRNDDS